MRLRVGFIVGVIGLSACQSVPEPVSFQPIPTQSLIQPSQPDQAPPTSLADEPYREPDGEPILFIGPTGPVPAGVHSTSPDKANHRIVKLVFGTNRLIDENLAPDAAFLNQRGLVRYGVATVSIPRLHKLGDIEQPKWWYLEFEPNPNKHMVLMSAEVSGPQRILPIAKPYFDAAPEKRAFVFVHGFNVSFRDAALRSAQLAQDLDLRSVPAFFSWSSQGNLTQYVKDENTALQTVPDLQKFLSDFVDITGADHVVVIAHSMGARIATAALVALFAERADLRPRFTELVLAAPDIDRAVFIEQLLPRFQQLQLPVTLYASSKDKALAASNEVHGCCRAGVGGAGMIAATGMESIDASNIDTDFLGHAYFSDTRPLLTDMTLLLSNGLRAGQRPTLEPLSQRQPTYWQFKR